MFQLTSDQIRNNISSLPQEFSVDILDIPGYELVLSCTHAPSKLDAIIAIHSLDLGPSLGGIRYFSYKHRQEALHDALRLSKAMTYKSATAGVGIGGGKSVIIGKPEDKTPALLHAFAEFVNVLEGRYIAAKDVGMTEKDLHIVEEKTPYVVGLDKPHSSGNPSHFTAWGVYIGMRSLWKKITGSTSLQGASIAIQGLGSVGWLIAERLFWEGADLLVNDIDPGKMELASLHFGASIVSEKSIATTKCDIFCPAALGAVLSSKNIPFLDAKLIAGAANNPLTDSQDAEMLEERGIIYAPDYVINAGGLFNVVTELDSSGYCPVKARERTSHVSPTLESIYDISRKKRISMLSAAKSLAEYRLQYNIGRRQERIDFHKRTIL